MFSVLVEMLSFMIPLTCDVVSRNSSDSLGMDWALQGSVVQAIGVGLFKNTVCKCLLPTAVKAAFAKNFKSLHPRAVT